MLATFSQSEVAQSSVVSANKLSYTENGAIVFEEDQMLALKWLFYARDCRSGVGERRLFRICLELLSQHHVDMARVLLSLVPEYGRKFTKMMSLGWLKNQLEKDKINMNENKFISLCAKWMPSGNTSYKETRQLFKCSERKYRQLLSKLRSFSKVIEVAMSAKKWDEINYAAVPSRANLIYKKAFLRNDRERRLAYLEKLKRGETKINSEKNFGKDLPDYVQGNGNTICVVDTSGSMTTMASRSSNVSCMEVAFALGIYFSEKSSGKFKNKFITFSSSPTLVDFEDADTLREKLSIIHKHSICSNTNIEAVFDLILSHATNNKLGQEELPNNILILSDCEFDSMVNINGGERPTNTFFDNMKIRFKNNGYILPRLVFWNICGRSGTIPVQKNSLGVALVSGFSPAVTKMVLSTDPFECLLEQLNDKRYQPVEDAIKGIIAKAS
ncbi:hypothetical protein H8356DRAFT_1421069 [Neocallimastix lanati (nom. inval.)]|nr:hypothetical protein H8356DRAFT_1421069 [Neocallimastix sp. JGI-2020a]